MKTNVFYCSQNPPVAEWAPQDVYRSKPGFFLRKGNFKSVAFGVSWVADILHSFTFSTHLKNNGWLWKQKFFLKLKIEG